MFEADIPMPIEFIQAVSHSLSHFKELPTTLSHIDLMKATTLSEYDPRRFDEVKFVHLRGDRLYTIAYKTLYVYSVSDPTSPVTTYQLGFMF